MRIPKGKIFPMTMWALFGALSTLILVEASMPTDASGRQSFSFSQILADIVNVFAPTKKATTLLPEAIHVNTAARSATIEGKKTYLFDADEAIVGTTKMYTYTLDFPDAQGDIYESAVGYEFLSTPGKDSYTCTFNSTKDSGALRIIPLKEGEYRFRLSDAGGNKQECSFVAKPRIAPKSIEPEADSVSLKQGAYASYPFSLSFGDLHADEEDPAHYLARYWDKRKTPFASSDPSIFTVEDGGLLYGKAQGEADLLYQGSPISRITVSGTYASSVAEIAISSSTDKLAPLDYDYEGYGAQLNVTYYDADHHVLDVDEPILFSSEDELIAKVDEEGFVAGYRKQGSTRVKASLAGHPDIVAYQTFESIPALPSKVTLKAFSGSQELPLSGGQLTAGATISFQADFEPINTSDKRLHVEAGEQKNIVVSNNNTNTPSLSFLDGGDFTFDVYSLALGQTSKKTYTLNVEARPHIAPSDMSDFHAFIRKAAGHFSLFFLTGIFGALAFIATFFKDKKLGMVYASLLALASGIVLAAISEAIQAIPALNRGASFSDILIDSLGFLFAVAITLGIYALVKHLRAKKKEPEQQEKE